MEDRNDVLAMLDLMLQPGFCVSAGTIIKVNQAAQGLCLRTGGEIGPMLKTGVEEYPRLEGGPLYLTLTLAGEEVGASVTRVGDLDVFVLDQDAENRELKALALAAQQLRGPLSSVMATAQRLFPLTAVEEDEAARDQASRLNRGLYQLLRVLANMSDAGQGDRGLRQETRALGSFFDELFEKAGEYLACLGLNLEYHPLRREVYGSVCQEQMERAVLNLLSNAIKFTPKGGTVRVDLARQGRFLRLTVADNGPGIPEELRDNVFGRYLRQPGLEDGRYGLGLGLVLIREAAASHGGVVLIDRPQGCGTRVCLTMDLTRKPSPEVRSQILTADYAGELDHWLVELADCLPPEAYTPE